MVAQKWLEMGERGRRFCLFESLRQSLHQDQCRHYLGELYPLLSQLGRFCLRIMPNWTESPGSSLANWRESHNGRSLIIHRMNEWARIQPVIYSFWGLLWKRVRESFGLFPVAIQWTEVLEWRASAFSKGWPWDWRKRICSHLSHQTRVQAVLSLW